METVLSAQFCNEPKTILLKSLFKNKTKMNNKALTTLFYCKGCINNPLSINKTCALTSTCAI